MQIHTSITGIISQTNCLTNVPLRSVEVKTYVWDAVQKTVSFTVTCLFPNTPRWQNTPLPRRGALVNVVGEIVGRTERSNQIVITIQAFNFIDVRGTEMATSGSMETCSRHQSHLVILTD